MRTRIKYRYIGNTAISNQFVNYEGNFLCIQIIKPQRKTTYDIYILNNNDVVEMVKEVSDVFKAKRIARNLLVNKYNVRLNDEIRGK